MLKKKEKKFIDKCSKILKWICIFIGIILGLKYLIDMGFDLLLFGLRESKTVVTYCIAIIILLGLYVIFNISDTPENGTKKQQQKMEYITTGIIIVILLFAILFVLTLFDFFLPLIVLICSLILIYYLVIFIIEWLVNKYGIK